MLVDNRHVYDSATLARQYTLENTLQPPEVSILNDIKGALPSARMLDIGVGGGRTTIHFAPLVREYVGIDYSEQMIAACKERFSEIPGRLTFQVADVCSLSMFPDQSFDFALFSYNGIDYMPHERRPAALKEIRRILRSGGYFALSTHNLNNLRERLRPKLVFEPRRMASSLLWVYRFLKHNPGSYDLHKHQYSEVYDGALGYRLRTHYVTPEQALDEFSESGFQNVRLFRLTTGESLQTMQGLNNITDDWLYFVCRT